MKFSQTKKGDPYENINFYPGPGFYEQNKKQEKGKETFGIGDRFKYRDLVKENSLGPGEYIGNNEWQSDEKKKGTRVKFESNPRKINTIPSIPGPNQTYGYRQTDDGYLVMIQDPRLIKPGQLGPGEYDAKYDILHKRVQGYVIKQSSPPKKVLSPIGNDDNSKVGPGTYDPKYETFKNQEPNSAGAKSNKIQKKRERSLNDNEIKTLEQLTLREVKDIPGPGEYYDKVVFSSFKPQAKPAEFQYFNSKEERFKEIRQDSLPGPGAYEPNSGSQSTKHNNQTDNKMFVFQDKRFKEIDVRKNIPGPGTYDLKSDFEMDEQAKRDINYPAAFGAGSKRFTDIRPATNLGPGSYTIPNKPKYKKKRQTAYVMPEMLNPPGSSLQHGDHNSSKNLQSLLNEFPVALPKGYNTSLSSEAKPKYSGKGTSVFASSTKRFDDKKSKGNQSIGPGSYNAKLNDFKVKSFNVYADSDLLSKEIRDKPKKTNLFYGEVGPGDYDFDLNVVRKKFTYDIRIKADPKSARTNGLSILS